MSQWEVVGAWHGGTVVSVALSHSAGNTQGLLASRAGLYGWTQPSGRVEPLTSGLSDLDVVAVAFAGGSGDSPAGALAATANGRLFRSTGTNVPGQEAWREIERWAGLGVAVVLAPSPAFDQDRTLFVGTPGGIYRTLDSGQSWESCNFGLLDEDVLSLVCAPTFAESELLWAGTAGGGLYRSRNSGRAWRESGLGLPDAAVQALAVSPSFAEDRTLYAGMEGHGLYLSRDGGESWNALALEGHSVNALACVRGDTLWAATDDGLWRVATQSGKATQVAAAGETVMSVAATTQGEVALGLYGSGLWLANGIPGDLSQIEWQKPLLALHAPPLVTTDGRELFALDAEGFIARSGSGGQWQEIESASAEMVFALHSARGTGDASPLVAATATGLVAWQGEAGWQEFAGGFASQPALNVVLSPAFEADKTLLVVGHENVLFISQNVG
jgi:photosystem II stability/assembly factor-like uncharacterized protein